MHPILSARQGQCRVGWFGAVQARVTAGQLTTLVEARWLMNLRNLRWLGTCETATFAKHRIGSNYETDGIGIIDGRGILGCDIPFVTLPTL